MGLALSEDPATEFGFLLHDVGKVAISDAILYKPGQLTAEERIEMQRHPVVGASIVAGIGFLGVAAQVVRHHHERWDGKGYPDGLAGEEIPLAARVFAVADVLDALTTDRPYRARMSFAVAREELLAGAGTHFDPAVIAVYEQLPDSTFEQIAQAIG
jgi:ribonuclease P protein subunit RPR2